MAPKSTLQPARPPVDAKIRAGREAPVRKVLAARPWDGACPGCGVVLRGRDGPTHAYLGASAACWNLYQRLARPGGPQPDSARVRRLLQGAYAAQHPGVPQRRAVQSVAVHLMDLCLLLERDGEDHRLEPVLGRTPPRKTLDLHWLEPPAARGSTTVVDALQADAGRAASIEAWAREVWAAWEPHHATVRGWLDTAQAGGRASAERGRRA
jgi:Family of unknown function (DUF5946)